MLTTGIKVLVKECTPDSVYNSIIYSDNHGNYKGVTGVVIKVLGEAGDKGILDFDPDMIFGEDMLDVIETPLMQSDFKVPDIKKKQPPLPGDHIKLMSLADLPEEERKDRDRVIKQMEEYRSILEGVSDKELYFKLYHDKLRSLLFETYGG